MSTENNGEDYDRWNNLKKKLNSKGQYLPIKEGEVWWCSVGLNIGVEVYGKNEMYSRPVVILRKFSGYGFLGVPLTSQQHTGSWYAEFEFKQKLQYAILSQIRVYSTSRLTDRMGTLPQSDLDKIKLHLEKLYK